jgi:hypothetical protein
MRAEFSFRSPSVRERRAVGAGILLVVTVVSARLGLAWPDGGHNGEIGAVSGNAVTVLARGCVTHAAEAQPIARAAPPE